MNAHRPFPEWLKVRIPSGGRSAGVRKTLKDLKLNTVCESAVCPNCFECFARGTATFMILGSVCTRNCGFCGVSRGVPEAVSADEPYRIAEAVSLLGLKHVVITSVTRDDLPDGGAEQFVKTIDALRRLRPPATVEVLIPDFGGEAHAIESVIDASPDVLNHNVETVKRLYPVVRPEADYARSLGVLRKAALAGLAAKSGFMVGLGESVDEVEGVIRDIRETGCEMLTVGQYLKPDADRLNVRRFVKPEEFEYFRKYALDSGFTRVASAPLVRSSYHAEVFLKSQERR